MSRFTVARVLVLIALVAVSPVALARDLSFEERVDALEKIERVYYSYLAGTSRSFEAAVPRAVLEAKVKRYLKQTVALEERWGVAITPLMLRRETERMAEQTRMPDRLRALFAALGNDPFLVQECLARQILVDRLARNYFTHDERIHDGALREAQALHRELTLGRVDPSADHPQRVSTEFVLADEGSGNVFNGLKPDATLPLSAEAFETWRRRYRTAVGEIGSIREKQGAFIIPVLLQEEPGRIRTAVYSLPKTTWDEWWVEASKEFGSTDVHAVATAGGVLPALSGSERAGAPCSPDDTWDHEGVPDARNLHTAVWTGVEVVVWGGRLGDATGTDTGSRYDPATDTWRATSTAGAPSPRRSHTAIWTGVEMIVWGGLAGGTPLDDGARYDPVSDTWTPVSTTGAPSPRHEHTAVWTGMEMIVWGGWDGVSYASQGGRYDPDTDQWTPVTTSGAPTGRRSVTAVWSGSRLIVWGGWNGSVLGDGGRYDPVTGTWEPTAMTDAPTARWQHTAVWTGDTMIVWGGQAQFVGNYLATGGRYDPITDTWQPTDVVGSPPGRRFHSAVWADDLMLIWGGSDSTNPVLNSGGGYDPVGDQWTSVSTDFAPEERNGHTAVWTGGLMIVWGGSRGPDALDSGGRYDPAEDRWTPMNITIPEARFRHTAVWTGATMIIWGGDAAGPISYQLNSGGQYDPATESWRDTSTLGIEPRRAHTAVWTGDRMIVWGGGTDGSDLRSGGRYDPIADTWEPTSMTNAPAVRGHNTAIWAGSEMVVWGGESPSPTSYLNTGGRYDPVGDTWTSTSTLNAPAGRSYHTAVWTGDLMIVWGGWGDVGSLNDGGKYDPSSDSWIPMDGSGSPSGHTEHTAVWTGSEMIVWGGYSEKGELDTGGKYDLVTNSWAPTSIVGAPEGRFRFTSVWTGNRMVVWGGTRSIGLPFNTGGRYDPVADTWLPTEVTGAPEGRNTHTAVWTGSHMLVWGGYGIDPVNSGAGYALGHSIDDDGDGFSECGGDCNDGHTAVFPGAIEICDGLDNDCDPLTNEWVDDDGDGPSACEGDCAPVDGTAFAVPGEIAGLALAADKETLSWTSAAPTSGSGTTHDVLRGAIDEFPVGTGPFESCLATGASSTASDPESPGEGEVFWYLVRGGNACGTGSYGFESGGPERVSGACP